MWKDSRGITNRADYAGGNLSRDEKYYRKWFLSWRSRWTTEAEFQAFCNAGLEDTAQDAITESMFRRAMSGEVVKKKPRFSITRHVNVELHGKCERCGAERDGARTYCQKCRAQLKPTGARLRTYDRA